MSQDDRGTFQGRLLYRHEPTDSIIIIIIIIIIEGPRSRCYGRTAALKAYCNPMRKMMKIMRFVLLLHFNGAPVE
jgi:hypothetical protein